MITDINTQARLKMELATIVDIGETFVESTYNWEGEGPLVLICFEEIKTFEISPQTGHYPNMPTILSHLAIPLYRYSECSMV